MAYWSPRRRRGERCVDGVPAPSRGRTPRDDCLTLEPEAETANVTVRLIFRGWGGQGYYTQESVCRVQPVEQPKGAPFWSPILLTMSMTVATTPTIAITIVTGINAFMDVASKVDKSPTFNAKM